MQIELLNKKLNEATSDAKIVLVINKDLTHASITDKETLELLGFKGESEETLFVPSSKTIYVGCDSLDADEVRLAA